MALELGLLAEVAADLVPVATGGGRTNFGPVTPRDVALGAPKTCIQRDRSTTGCFRCCADHCARRVTGVAR